MTIYQDNGNDWIDIIEVPMTIPVGAGSTFASFNLTRGGHWMGGSISVRGGGNTTASQAMGAVRFADDIGGSIALGAEVNVAMGLYVNKEASADPDTIQLVLIMFMKK